MADNTVAIDIEVKVGDLEGRLSKIEASLGGIAKNGKKVGDEVAGGFDAAEKGAKAASEGTKSFGGSIGTVLKSLGLIAIAAEVFMFIKDLLMKNQKVVDALGIAFKAIEVLFGMLTDALKPLSKSLKSAFEDPQQALKDLWEAIKTNFLNRIKGIAVAAEGVGKVIEGAFSMDWDKVKKGMQQYGQALIQVSSGLDIEQQNNFVNGIVDAGTEALNTAKRIQELTNAVKLAEAQQGLLMLEYQREAELQRQIRDDISLTIGERQEANAKLGTILDEQSAKELELSNQRLELALMEESINKGSIDAEVEVINARKEIADINERITGQRSEQLTNENGLIQENIDKIKAQADVDAEAAALRKARVLDLEQQLADSRIALIQNEELRRILEVEARRDRLIEEITEDDAVARELKENLRQLAQAELNAIEDESLAKELARLEEANKKKKKIEDQGVKDIAEAEKEKQALRGASFDAASGLVNSLGQLVAASGEQSKGAVALQKTIAVAGIAIDTAKAVVGAIAQAQSVPYPGNLIAMATGVAAVVAGIASAVATLNSSSMPGPSAAPPPSASSAMASASAPSIEQVNTNSTDLGNSQGAQLAPIQAFVIETEMTGNQQNISQIENQVTFGIDG